MTLNYALRVAVVDTQTGKAKIEKFKLTLDHPFTSYIELTSAFFHEWENPDKYNGRYTFGIIDSELI